MFSEPKVGDEVYIDTELYLSRGEDDFSGGICTICTVKIHEHLPKDHVNYYSVEVEQNKGTFYSWGHLCNDQEKLKEKFGNKKGFKKPDYRPEFNE